MNEVLSAKRNLDRWVRRDLGGVLLVVGDESYNTVEHWHGDLAREPSSSPKPVIKRSIVP